jgi:hypothetical protein
MQSSIQAVAWVLLGGFSHDYNENYEQRNKAVRFEKFVIWIEKNCL